MAARIKGQDVEIVVLQDAVPVAAVTAVKSFEIAFQQDILTEGYLGETTNRKDDIFNGSRGRMELHSDSQDILVLAQAITNRSQRRTAGITFNIKATLNYPNGDRPRVVLPDVSWGEIPLSFGGRAEYGTVTLEFEGSSVRILF